jgi:hypothetical protein
MDYIDALVNIFADHAKKFDKKIEEEKMKYEKFYPNDELPEHLLKPFNLSWALWVICNEIIEIKKKL